MNNVQENTLVVAGVECGKKLEYPVITVFPNNELGHNKSKTWVCRSPEQVPGIAHHIRIRHLKVINKELLNGGNIAIAKIILN